MTGNLKNPHQDFTEISGYPMDLNGNAYFVCHVGWKAQVCVSFNLAHAKTCSLCIPIAWGIPTMNSAWTLERQRQGWVKTVRKPGEEIRVVGIVLENGVCPGIASPQLSRSSEWAAGWADCTGRVKRHFITSHVGESKSGKSIGTPVVCVRRQEAQLDP